MIDGQYFLQFHAVYDDYEDIMFLLFHDVCHTVSNVLRFLWIFLGFTLGNGLTYDSRRLVHYTIPGDLPGDSILV